MIPAEMTSLSRWVCVWNDSKVPMQASVKKAASPSDPSTWSDYRTAKGAVDSGMYDGLGFMLGDGIVGIDIDHGYDEAGVMSAMATDIICKCWTFTERSRSGRGFHIYVKGTLPFSGKNNRNGCEIYGSGRFFIVTGNEFLPDILPNSVMCNQLAINHVLDTYFSTAPGTGEWSKRQYCPVYEPPVGPTIKVRPTYPPVGEGCRNQSLASLAGQLHITGYPPREIFKELMWVNNNVCDKPLPRSEVITIVSSILRYKRC